MNYILHYSVLIILIALNFSKFISETSIAPLSTFFDMSGNTTASRTKVIDELIKALNQRLMDSDVQLYLSPELIEQSRQQWIKEFNESQNLIYTSHQGSSAYLVYLIRHLPLMDIKNNDFNFNNLYDNALWAFHVRGLYPWSKKWNEQVYLDYVLPHAVLDEPRRGNWRHEFHSLIERRIMINFQYTDSCSETVRNLAALINREIWSKFKGDEIIYAPNLTPEIMAPKDIIEKKRASCTGLSLLLIYAYRSVGIPCRLAGVYSWKDEQSESHPSVIARRKLLEGRSSLETHLLELNNHSWVEIYDGERWIFTEAHEAPDGDLGFNKTWFYPSKTNLQVPNDPIYGIYGTIYSDHRSIFPLAWNPLYRGVYCHDITNYYLNGYPIGINPQY